MKKEVWRAGAQVWSLVDPALDGRFAQRVLLYSHARPARLLARRAWRPRRCGASAPRTSRRTRT